MWVCVFKFVSLLVSQVWVLITFFIGVSAVIGSMLKKGSLKKKTSSVIVAAKGIKKRVLKKPGAKGSGYIMLSIYVFMFLLV